MVIGRKLLTVGLGSIASVLYSGCNSGVVQTPHNIQTTGGGIVCDCPYMQDNDGCCLDRNFNSICDYGESPNNIEDVVEEVDEATLFGIDCVKGTYLEEEMRNLGLVRAVCDYVCRKEQETTVVRFYDACLAGVIETVNNFGGYNNSSTNIGRACVDYFYENGDNVEKSKEFCYTLCATIGIDENRDEAIGCMAGVGERFDEILPRYIDNITFTSGEMHNVSNMLGKPDGKYAELYPGARTEFCLNTEATSLLFIAVTGEPCNRSASLELTGLVDGRFENVTGGQTFLITSCLGPEVGHRIYKTEFDLNRYPGGLRCFGLHFDKYASFVLAIDAVEGN